MSEQDVREGWRKNWLSGLQEFADNETQRLAWMNPLNANPHFGFVELYECYFGDLEAVGGYKLAVAEGLVSAAEANAVAAFHELAESYESPADGYDHDAILADPKWATVVRAAKEAQSSLSPLLTEASERASLLERSSYAIEAIRSS